MKRLAVLLCSVLLLSLFTGCGSMQKQGDVNDASNPEKKEITETVESNADMKVNYDTLEKLINDSEIIVYGKVTDTKSYVLGPGVVTEYKLQVEDTLYGAPAKGSTVDFISAGGIVPYSKVKKLNVVEKDFEKDDKEKQQKAGYVKYTFNGAPLIEKDKEYVIFAQKQDIGSGRKMYGALGISQGQFLVDNNEVLQYDASVNSKAKKWEKDNFIADVGEKVKLIKKTK